MASDFSAVVLDGTLVHLDASTGMERKVAQVAGWIADAAVSRDGCEVLLSTRDGQVMHVGVSGGAKQRLQCPEGLPRLHAMENGVLVGDAEGVVQYVTFREGVPRPIVRMRGAIVSIQARGTTGDVLITSRQGQVVNLASSTLAPRTLVDWPGAEVINAHIAADGVLLAVLLADQSVSVVSCPDGRLICQLNASHIVDLALHPESESLAAIEEGGNLVIWDSTWKRRVLGQVGAGGLAWSPRGGLLAASGLDNEVVLFEPESGIALLRLRGSSDRVRNVAFLGQGRAIAALGGGVCLWRLAK